MKIGQGQGVGPTDKSVVDMTDPAAGSLTMFSLAPGKIESLGIPESDLTPRVREALRGLLGDSERLLRETEALRARLDEATRNADQDMLLPVLNRRAFTREVSRFISFAKRYGTPAILLYFDLDRFKAVNDTHGHAAGDKVLLHFCSLIASQIREGDVLARLGGDEFGVILSHVTAEQARKKGERLAEALADHPPVWNGVPIPLSASLGTHVLKADETAEAAIADADRDMFEHKRAAR